MASSSPFCLRQVPSPSLHCKVSAVPSTVQPKPLQWRIYSKTLKISSVPLPTRSVRVLAQPVIIPPEAETQPEPPSLAEETAEEIQPSQSEMKPKKTTRGMKNIMQAFPSDVKAKKTAHGMNIIEVGALNRNAAELLSKDKIIPDIRTGDIVQLRVEVAENRKRASVLRGIVIAKNNAGSNSTFRIRRVMSGIGVEMVFPLYSPNIKEIKIIGSRDARRAKLLYLREKKASLSSC